MITLKKNWFEKHQGIWTFCATLISGLALIISIFVMLEQSNTSRKNLYLVEQQIKLAQAQFDSSNADKKYLQQESIKKFNYEDSINNLQLALASNQFNLQKYVSHVQVENESPIIQLDSIWLDKYCYNIAFTNKGKRPFLLKEVEYTYFDEDYKFIMSDTFVQPYKIIPDISLIAHFYKTIPDSILNEAWLELAYIKVNYFDFIVNKNLVDKRIILITGLSHSQSKESNGRIFGKKLEILSIVDPKVVKFYETFLKNRNWKYFKNISQYVERLRV